MSMLNLLPVSVMLSTYSRVDSSWLNDSLNSLVSQFSPPSEIIIILDGPVPDSQHDVINFFINHYKFIDFIVVQSEKNFGLAYSMNIALDYVSFPWVARMDSDDICRLDRLRIQYDMAISANLDVVCSWHAEFFDDISLVTSIKKTPQTNAYIKKLLNYRNVVSHPTVLIKTDVLKKVGGYDVDVGFLEDYDLYLRLMEVNANFSAVQEALVFVRISKEQLRRRGGFNYVANEFKYRWSAFLKGRISFSGFFVGSIFYPFFRLLPSEFKSILYKFVRSAV
jgi:glycosyltransferase involved in cell wall biosynthesis